MPGPVDMNNLNILSQNSALQSAAGKTKVAKNDAAELEKACKDFESLFIDHMMREMRKTVPREGLFGGGQAEQIYTGMLDTELSKSISSQRGIGLATVMYRQMSQMFEKK